MGNKDNVPKSGFGLALIFTLITFILVIYGALKSNLHSTVISLITGALGLYYIKKSWISYEPDKDKK